MGEYSENMDGDNQSTKAIVTRDLLYALLGVVVISFILGTDVSSGLYIVASSFFLLVTIVYTFLFKNRPDGLRRLSNITRWLVLMRAATWLLALYTLGVREYEIGALLAAASLAVSYWLLLEWRLVLNRGEVVDPMKQKNILLALISVTILKYLMVGG